MRTGRARTTDDRRELARAVDATITNSDCRRPFWCQRLTRLGLVSHHHVRVDDAALRPGVAECATSRVRASSHRGGVNGKERRRARHPMRMRECEVGLR